jgi:hypothetical protein
MITRTLRALGLAKLFGATGATACMTSAGSVFSGGGGVGDGMPTDAGFLACGVLGSCEALAGRETFVAPEGEEITLFGVVGDLDADGYDDVIFANRHFQRPGDVRASTSCRPATSMAMGMPTSSSETRTASAAARPMRAPARRCMRTSLCSMGPGRA